MDKKIYIILIDINNKVILDNDGDVLTPIKRYRQICCGFTTLCYKHLIPSNSPNLTKIQLRSSHNRDSRHISVFLLPQCDSIWAKNHSEWEIKMHSWHNWCACPYSASYNDPFNYIVRCYCSLFLDWVVSMRKKFKL